MYAYIPVQIRELYIKSYYSRYRTDHLWANSTDESRLHILLSPETAHIRSRQSYYMTALYLFYINSYSHFSVPEGQNWVTCKSYILVS